MSLQSNMAVMRAKLAGNTPQLIALAQQGDFEAAAALKEMMDKKAYAQSVADQTAMGQPDTLPVLEQIAGNLDAPQSGIAAYAGGGEARSRIGYSWDADPSVSKLDRWGLANQARRGDVGGRVTQRDVWLANNPNSAVYDDPTIDNMGAAVSTGFDRVRSMLSPGTNYSNEGSNYPASAPAAPYPEPVQVRSPETKKQTARASSYTGIAAAAAPRESSGPPQKSQPVPPAQILEGPPPAEELGDKELLAATEKLTTLQKERDALRDKSRAQLEAAYNEKVKALTPSKFDKIMTFLAGVQGHGGRSAAQALGAGAQKMYGLEKAANAQKTTLKEAWARADLLEQQALVADRMKDVEGAMALRKEALELRRQAKKDEAATGLQKSQAGYYDAQTRYTDTIKPVVEGKKADAAVTRAGRAGRAGLGAGAGKPMTPAQRASETRRLFDMAKEDLNNDQVPDSVLWDRAAAQVERNSVKPAAASPAGPSVKFLGFE